MRAPLPRMLLGVLVLLVVGACSSPSPRSSGQSPGASQEQRQSGGRKVINLALQTIIDGFSIAASSTTSGGGLSYIEIHSQALFTSDKTTGRPIPRLLTELPTQQNGGLRLTPDGKMIATYKLRTDVKWADGASFTSKDLLFTYKTTKDPNLPIIDTGPSKLMESVSAPDDHTFVINWSEPYYMADAIGLRAFWPLPAHILESHYTTIVEGQKDHAAFLALPYWSSEYVHIGPFKLASMTSGVEAAFDAIPDYFLGKPKVDRIVVKQFGDSSTILAGVLAGAIDVTMEAVLTAEQAMELKRRWDVDKGGTVYVGVGTTQFVSIQFDSSVSGYQPALLNKTVRQALYHGIDRDAYADTVSGGIPNMAANAMLPPDNPLYSYVKDAWKVRYPFDTARAGQVFEQAGWRLGGDSLLANAAGERLHLETRATADNEARASIIGDMWKRVGVDTEIVVVPAARVRDREYRQQFPGGEITARGSQDAILTRLECSEQPTSQNRFSGNNRGHWCNQDYERLVNGYRTNLVEEGRGQAFKQIQDLVLEELPILLLNTQVSPVVARRGVTAFEDDFPGGSEAGRIYGTYSRNAHEWDVR
jgi:peptide/nickel transport system substrate-binding protein